MKMKNKTDELYMSLALALAAKARGFTSPNPMVGAIIVKDGEIVGKGCHRRAGGPHAEILALKNAGPLARGAVMYINLEPCSHQGRTPACAPVVAASGLKKVVAAMTDPNPKVAGCGFGILRESGMTVVTGVLEKQALRLNEYFVKHITTGMPFVILKGAMSLDGKIATSTGESKWITSEASRLDAHLMRAEVDAMLIGSATLLRDDPQLTCRAPGKHNQPYRVVLDSNLVTPVKSNFCKLAGDGKTIIATLETSDPRRARKLEKLGCQIIRVPADNNGKINVAKLLRELGKMRIISVLVEGGGETSFSFLSSGCADKIVYYIAPKLVGGANSPTPLEGAGVPKLADAPQLHGIEITRAGEDIKLVGYLK